MRVPAVRATQVQEDLRTTRLEDQLIRVLAVPVMRAPVVLGSQGLVVPRTMLRAGLGTQGREVLLTTRLVVRPIQAPAVHATRVRVVLATRARAERVAGVPLCADDRAPFHKPPNSGLHGERTASGGRVKRAVDMASFVKRV